MEWIQEANKKEEHLNEVLSFDQYMDHFYSYPEKECRPTCQYLIDMFNYFGKNEDGTFKVFTTKHPGSPAVFGQKEVQYRVYQNLKNFQEEGYNNKFILLVGPNGSSKSSIIKQIMTGSEEYSKEDDGKLYTFSWIFPIDAYVKGSLSLTSTGGQHNLESYAHLEEKDISAILPSELKDHPILLIPLEWRREIIEKSLDDNPALLEIVKNSYLYNGDVSKRNRMIYDSLLKTYKGDHAKVLKHIRVERFTISKRYSSAAVTIEPQLHLDARMQQITMDKRLASLPPSLQSLNLFSMGGEAIMANRGLLEFSDLLKRPLDAFKYLLTTMETRNININGILTELDIFFIGSSNEVHLAAFKQHPDFNSFKGRFNFVKVPYLLDYKSEMKIYLEQLETLKDKMTIEPLSLDVLCLFNVMSRLRPPLEKNFKNKQVGKLVASLTPLEKSLFISDGTLPERFKIEERKLIRSHKREIFEEFKFENLYEGKFGISPRTVKQIIYDLSSKGKNCTFVDVIDFLATFIEQKQEHDFLNISPQGDYHNPPRFLESLKAFALDSFDDQVRESLGLVDERSYDDYIGRYIHQITALLKNEKIRNNVTGKYENCDMYFIQEFEKSIKVADKVENFRSHLISKLGAYHLDNPGKKIVYTEVFPDMVKKLQSSFVEEQKKKISKIAQNMVFYLKEKEVENAGKGEKSISLNSENRHEIESLINVLQEKHGYSYQGTLTLLRHLIQNRY